jgi:HK97 family phage major capsid protein
MNMHARPRDNLLVQYATAVLLSRGTSKSPALIAGERYGFNDGPLLRALLSDIDGAGLIPLDLDRATVIDALRPLAVIRRNFPAANFINMPHGNIIVPKVARAASAGFIGEDQATQIGTEPGFGALALASRKVYADVPISNSALRFGAGEIEDVVQRDLLRTLAQVEDKAFIQNPGSQYAPRGLITSAATTNAATALEAANIPMTVPLWLMNPVQKDLLAGLTTSSGQFLFPEMREGRLFSYPYEATNGVPAGTILFVDMGEVLVGTAYLEVRLMGGAAYRDSSGALVSAFDRDESLVRAIAGVDINVKHPEAVAVLNGISWS